MKVACFLLSVKKSETIWLNQLKYILLSTSVLTLEWSCWVSRESQDTNQLAIGLYQAIIDCMGYALVARTLLKVLY